MKTMKTLRAFAVAASAAVCVLLAHVASASEGPEVKSSAAPIDPTDVASLQRGAKLFVNYCLGCHSAQHMRYNRMVDDLHLTDKLVVENLIQRGTFERDGTYTMDKIGDTMRTTLVRAEAKAAFGVVPPDLSVEARVRGVDWLYAYLRGFYRDDKTTTGWNNLVFPNVAMPNVLWELSGPNRVISKEFSTIEEAKGAMAQTHVVATLETVHPRAGSEQAKSAGQHGALYVLRYVEPEHPGTMTRRDYERSIVDIVNFLAYIAEPAKLERIRLGIKVLIFLAILFVFAYWTKRAFWKDVH